jgi:hypothetical protein
VIISLLALPIILIPAHQNKTNNEDGFAATYSIKD